MKVSVHSHAHSIYPGYAMHCYSVSVSYISVHQLYGSKDHVSILYYENICILNYYYYIIMNIIIGMGLCVADLECDLLIFMGIGVGHNIIH